MEFIPSQVLTILYKTAFIWGPLLLVYFFIHEWIRYVQQEFIANIDWALLEIKVSRDVHKSPEAMEIVLNALYDGSGTSDWVVRWWKGQVRLWSSLEIISVEGSLYFFIRVHRKFKDLVTSQVYSQYPQAEVREVDDYVRYVPEYLPSNQWSLFGTEMKLSKPDVYPIKTYVDYGMDRALSLEEEQRIDPITPFLEFLSTLRKGEHFWMQIMVRAAAKKPPNTPLGILWQFSKGDDWLKPAKDEIKKFLEENASKKVKKGEEEVKEVDLTLLTPGKKKVLEALERSITKPGFEVGIRWIYLAPKDNFRGTNVAALTTLFRQYGAGDLNSFGVTNATNIDFAWQDYKNKKLEKMKKEIYDLYVDRAFFYAPYSGPTKPFILNTEELATIFHFPGRTAETPSFERVSSRKAEPPSNLPTE